jgi:hypothetical protein
MAHGIKGVWLDWSGCGSRPARPQWRRLRDRRLTDCYTFDRRTKLGVIVVNIDGTEIEKGDLFGGSQMSSNARDFGRWAFEESLESVPPLGKSAR